MDIKKLLILVNNEYTGNHCAHIYLRPYSNKYDNLIYPLDYYQKYGDTIKEMYVYYFR